MLGTLFIYCRLIDLNSFRFAPVEIEITVEILCPHTRSNAMTNRRR